METLVVIVAVLGVVYVLMAVTMVRQGYQYTIERFGKFTTVAQPGQDMVDATVAMLLDQMNGGKLVRRAAVLPAKLVVRGSSRVPPVARREAKTT